jgi:hypothetical protein
MKSGVPDDVAAALARAAQNTPPAPMRQMELPLDAQDAMRLAQEQDGAARLFSPQAGLRTYDGTPAFDRFVSDKMPAPSPTAPDMDLGSDLWHQMDKSARGYENILKGRTGNLRNQNPDLARIAQQNIQGQNAAAAARRAADSQPSGAMDLAIDLAVPAAVAGGGAYAMSQLGQPQMPPVETTTADLAAESRPAPQVAATDEDGLPTNEAAFTEMFKRQYQAREDKREAKGKGGYADPSDKAKAILDDLNARRRKAGREVPEASQMEDEANSALALANSQRNAPGYKPRNATDPREQAQMLLQKLNADRMEAGGEVPHSQQVLAEVRRLQAMGDQQRFPSR